MWSTGGGAAADRHIESGSDGRGKKEREAGRQGDGWRSGALQRKRAGLKGGGRPGPTQASKRERVRDIEAAAAAVVPAPPFRPTVEAAET